MPNCAWVLDTDMSAEVSGIRWPPAHRGAASGRRPTSAMSRDHEASHRCRSGPSSGLHGRRSWLPGAGAAATGCCRCWGPGCAAGCDAGCWGGGASTSAGQGLSAHRDLGPPRRGGRLDRRRGDQPHRGQVDDVAGSCVDLDLDLLGHRTYVHHDRVREVVVPAPALPTPVLHRRPRQGGEADAEGRERGDARGSSPRTAAGPTPPACRSWWTTSSPAEPCPGGDQRARAATAKASQTTTAARRRTRPTTDRRLVVETNPPRRTTPRKEVHGPGEQPVDGVSVEPAVQAGRREGRVGGGRGGRRGSVIAGVPRSGVKGW